MEAFRVNIIGLSNRTHEFTFKLEKPFFEEFGKDLLTDGNFDALISLDKHETFIEANFKIKGVAKLICDRSLEPFEETFETEKKMVFKYGAEEEEISDEIQIIPHDKESLDLSQCLYEFISLAIPMKKIHPKFRDEYDDDPEEGKIIYQSSKEKEGDIDPRWEKLKKLK